MSTGSSNGDRIGKLLFSCLRVVADQLQHDTQAFGAAHGLKADAPTPDDLLWLRNAFEQIPHPRAELLLGGGCRATAEGQLFGLGDVVMEAFASYCQMRSRSGVFSCATLEPLLSVHAIVVLCGGFVTLGAGVVLALPEASHFCVS